MHRVGRGPGTFVDSEFLALELDYRGPLENELNLSIQVLTGKIICRKKKYWSSEETAEIKTLKTLEITNSDQLKNKS